MSTYRVYVISSEPQLYRYSLKLQQLGAQVKINVDTSPTPPRLQQDAEAAARSGSLQTHVCVPGHAERERERAVTARASVCCGVGF